MSSASFKQDLFAQFGQVAKALANGKRLELLEYLAQGERSVEALAKVSGLGVTNVSHHLQQLRRVGLVEARKDGLYVYYRVSGSDVVDLLSVLRHVAERHVAAVDRLVRTCLTVKDDLEPISREELLKRAGDGTVTVLDVRPPEEYTAGHLPGAVSMPLSKLKKHIAELDPAQEVVAYCRGPHCVLAFDAVAQLRARGLKARRLEEGFPEWQAEGLPVEGRP
jgi:rhodanese-related sulfurtransferase/predicted transcriptional regulator